MIEPCLRVENLHVTYDIGSTAFGRRRRLHAVNGVSFEIGAGETLGLVGESGSGKSTTGLAILRLIEPAAGKVTLAGTDLTALGRGDLRALRRHMQMVFQDPYSSLNPSMTIQQLLEEPLIVHADLSRPERRDAVAGMLESVGLHADYCRALSARILRRPAPADRDRPCDDRGAGIRSAGRTGQRAGRIDAEPDPEFAEAYSGRFGHGIPAGRARPGGRPADEPTRRGDVSRRNRRGGTELRASTKNRRIPTQLR